MKRILSSFMREGRYLPKFMRDFHDQKDLFKTIHEKYCKHFEDPKNLHTKHIHWQDGQVYVIDVFLWFMAQHGYTLQKTRNLEHYDIDTTLTEAYDKRNREMADAMGLTLVKDKDDVKGV